MGRTQSDAWSWVMKSLIVLHALMGDGACIAQLRQSLDRLWSEDPCAPSKIVVFAPAELSELVRRDYRAVEVVEASPVSWIHQMNQLVFGSRCPMTVFLSSGSEVTPGWLKELRNLANDQASIVGSCWLGHEVNTEGAIIGAVSRADLRRRATKKRFGAARTEEVNTLNNNCLVISRSTMRQLGYFDQRFNGFSGVLVDYQRRFVAGGGKLLRAERVLMSSVIHNHISPGDLAALEMREAFYQTLSSEVFTVALELEVDDVDFPHLVTLANSFVQRGIQLVTISARTQPEGQPSSAPHLSGASLRRLAQTCSLVLVRSDGLLNEMNSLHVSFEQSTRSKCVGDRYLHVPREGINAVDFDHIASAIIAHLRVT